ncbi:alpha/beta fold hydrolase [Altibacter lentus]|uniref:alpha/beta fold hydrolase n=1 Tax=Altibacter lentus TaxID=1223410 RepID=UPI0005539C9C|nr:alpha/beta hydrolase [Altibacter lentus]
MTRQPFADLARQFNITISGKGSQPMLFAHGYGCDQNMWRFVSPHFEATHKTVLFDYIGAGKSDVSAYDPTTYSSLDAYADDVIAICDHLNLSNVIFVGHSVSSMIGVLAANKRSDLFSKLVLVGPSPRYINDEGYIGGFDRGSIDDLLEALDSNYLGWSTSMAPVIMGNPERPELGKELSNSFCQTDPEIAKNFARATFLSDNRDDLTKLKVPALVMQCSQDVIAPLEVGTYVAEQIPNSTLKILEATGHCPNLSAPEETVRTIQEFLKT